MALLREQPRVVARAVAAGCRAGRRPRRRTPRCRRWSAGAPPMPECRSPWELFVQPDQRSCGAACDGRGAVPRRPRLPAPRSRAAAWRVRARSPATQRCASASRPRRSPCTSASPAWPTSAASRRSRGRGSSARRPGRWRASCPRLRPPTAPARAYSWHVARHQPVRGLPAAARRRQRRPGGSDLRRQHAGCRGTSCSSVGADRAAARSQVYDPARGRVSALDRVAFTRQPRSTSPGWDVAWFVVTPDRRDARLRPSHTAPAAPSVGRWPTMSMNKVIHVGVPSRPRPLPRRAEPVPRTVTPRRAGAARQGLGQLRLPADQAPRGRARDRLAGAGPGGRRAADDRPAWTPSTR